jgi:hypothetical protein
VTEALVALVSLVVGILAGYVFGVLRTLNERRNERRDDAIAEIYRLESLFYHSVVSWTANPTSAPPTASNWELHCRNLYREFTDAYHANSIWLGSDTYELIKEFGHAGKDILNEFRHMDRNGQLPSGKSAWDRRAEVLMPKHDKVEDALRTEMEWSRSLTRALIPTRLVNRRNEPEG